MAQIKRLICSKADMCNKMCKGYGTDIICAHKEKHQFIRPKAIDRKLGSCIPRQCFIINEEVKCVPYNEESEEDQGFFCPMGYEGYNYRDETCHACDLQEKCIDEMIEE
jgi:hypothetical protein